MSVRPSRLRPSRPNWIAAQALALICITVTLGLILGLQTRAQFGEIDLSQRAYAEETAAKGALISDLRDTLGYGGVIHNFKNFVLRQDVVYLLETEEQIARFRETIDRYLDLVPTPQERAALDEIAAAITTYEGMLPLAIAAAEQDWSPARTDAAVRVDDAGALAALAELERLWRAARGANTERVAKAVEQGRTLIWVGFLALGALVLAALIIGYLLRLLHRDLRQTLVRLNGELDDRRALEQAQSRLATIVEQAPTTILLTDTSGRIEYANAKFEALTGWSRAEIAGQTPAFLQSGDTSAAGYSEIRARLARGEIWRGVFRNLRKDGSSYWAETTILPLLGPDGAVRNFAGLGEDITEARKARDQVVRAQKLEAVGQLAGGVAHDFNNILTTVIASAYLASLDAPEGSDIAHEIAQIDVAARRAQSLVRELLTFARREPARRQAVVLAEIVTEVVALMGAAIPPLIELRFDPPERRFTVLGDATHIHQIVMNLCRNATEAIGAGSGVIEITLAAAPDDQVRLSVRDDGPGMSQDTLCHLFEPFFTTKAVGKGSGLGLSVVFTLVEEMGGRIDVSSEIGAGARFDIDLPLTGDAAVGADAAEPELPRGSERVLLIDDEAEVAGSFRRLLLRLGYRVDAYTAPRQALDRFRRDPAAYDLVVTDLVMPDLSGLELAASLREVRADVPILFVTAFRPGEIAIPGPVPETLEKPVNPNRFAHHIRKALDGEHISTHRENW